MKDIIKRCPSCDRNVIWKDYNKQIEQLQAENERLLMANKAYAIQQELYEHKNTEIQNLIAENDRLKAVCSPRTIVEDAQMC